jgi:hypothetical protein
MNLPRTFCEPETVLPIREGRSWGGLRTVAVLALAVIGAVLATGCGTGHHAATDHTVGTLLAGIPQEGATLGDTKAPFTIEVFIDLEDPTSRWWFREDLPAIIDRYVRPGTVKLQYRAFKRNTYWPAVFVDQQTAALAAGAQNKLWTYIDTFFYEQGRELTRYVTESYLEGIARQIPGLDLDRWHADRHTGRREEQTTAEDQNAKAIGLHVTPAFRIGNTTSHMSTFASSHATIRYAEQKHPIALIEPPDIAHAISLITNHKHIPPADRAVPVIVYKRLE